MPERCLCLPATTDATATTSASTSSSTMRTAAPAVTHAPPARSASSGAADVRTRRISTATGSAPTGSRPEQLRRMRQRLRGGPGLRRRTVSAAMRRMPRAREQRMRPEGHRQGHRLRRRLRRHAERLEQLRVLRQRLCRRRYLPERRLHRRRLSRPVVFVRGGYPPHVTNVCCRNGYKCSIGERDAACCDDGDEGLRQPRRILLPGGLHMLR